MIINELKITVLSENTVGRPKGLTGEWGLSMLVQTDRSKILFDTGQRGNLLANAAALGVDLKSVDILVLSHGHFDHTGGMQAFLKQRGGIPVYAHANLFSRHYSSPGEPAYIGVPYTRQELEALGAEFIFIEDKPREICPGIWISGEIPRKNDFERVESSLFCIEGNNRIIPDPLKDDLSLFCATREGLVIVLGCAHAGLVNIVEYARTVTGIDKIYGIIGGTHLGPASIEQQEATIEFIKNLDLECLAPNHCTGLPMMSRLANIFGKRFYFAPAGTSFILPFRQ